eukprot:37480-Rhodomonas_salina.1
MAETICMHEQQKPRRGWNGEGGGTRKIEQREGSRNGNRTEHIKKAEGKEKLSTERAGGNRTVEGDEERRGDEERKGSAG